MCRLYQLPSSRQTEGLIGSSWPRESLLPVWHRAWLGQQDTASLPHWRAGKRTGTASSLVPKPPGCLNGHWPPQLPQDTHEIPADMVHPSNPQQDWDQAPPSSSSPRDLRHRLLRREAGLNLGISQHCGVGLILHLVEPFSCCTCVCMELSVTICSRTVLKECSSTTNPPTRQKQQRSLEQTFLPPNKVIVKIQTFLRSLFSWFADFSIRKHFWSYTIHIPKNLRRKKKYGNNGRKTFMLLSLQSKFKTYVFFLSNFFLQIGPYSSHCLIFAKPAKYRALMNVQVMSFQKVQGHLKGENSLLFQLWMRTVCCLLRLNAWKQYYSGLQKMR